VFVLLKTLAIKYVAKKPCRIDTEVRVAEVDRDLQCDSDSKHF
jgi:hypothetical protein